MTAAARVRAAVRSVAADGDVTAVVIVAAVVTYPAGRAVAHWCHVADPWSWLYPGIADGLALVAYRVTDRAADKAGRCYAWSVVLVCAVMSALGQAIHLVGLDRPAPAGLRFAVGAWPALAGAVAWHLRRVAGRRPATALATVTVRPPVAGPPVTSVATEAPAAVAAPEATVNGHRPAATPDTATLAGSVPPVSTDPDPDRVLCPAGCRQMVSARTGRRHRDQGCPTPPATEKGPK